MPTFQGEYDSLHSVPGLLWERPTDYQFETGGSPFEGMQRNNWWLVEGALFQRPGKSLDDEMQSWRHPRAVELAGGGFYYLDRSQLLGVIQDAAEHSGQAIREVFQGELGLDLDRLLADAVELVSDNLEVAGKQLSSLTCDFGMEAFGVHLPWHGYWGGTPPWGIYMFLEKLVVWSAALWKTGRYLPAKPKPDLIDVFRRMWWLTYRHEVFHHHVEMFSVRLEVCTRHPAYRPYVERVGSKVRGTSQRWEEALAQAVVLRSRKVKGTLGINAKYMKEYIIPCFRENFPDGYRHFECSEVGGPDQAHAILSAQISRAELNPKHLNTPLAWAKHEYREDDSEIPGYLVISPLLRYRFQ